VCLNKISIVGVERKGRTIGMGLLEPYFAILNFNTSWRQLWRGVGEVSLSEKMNEMRIPNVALSSIAQYYFLSPWAREAQWARKGAKKKGRRVSTPHFLLLLLLNLKQEVNARTLPIENVVGSFSELIYHLKMNCLTAINVWNFFTLEIKYIC
jgi:hypothetical protein